MSGGFFRGTSADQDTRFSNKQAKLLKSQKFAPELDHPVDMTKVKMDVIRPWIANRATELLGFEDEVLINFIYGLLDGKDVDGKQIQIQLTGFMEKNTGKFMKELWGLLLSAQKNVSGVPQQFLDAKEEETRKKKVEADWITQEIQKRKEKEGRESELEKQKKLDSEGDVSRVVDAASDAIGRHSVPRVSSIDVEHNGEMDEKHGLGGRNRLSKSPHSMHHSPSPHRSTPSATRSSSKSFSRSRSYSDERRKSRSISNSPQLRRHSVSPENRYCSPHRRSLSPTLKYSPRSTRSPPRWRSPHLRRRSTSRSRRRSQSPIRRRSPPLMRRRSPSPLRRISPSPVRRRSLSPLRRGSPSPVRRRSPSPRRRRSPSPVRRRSPSPMRRRSPPMRRRSPLVARRRSPLPPRRRSPSPRWRSPSPRHYRSPSPIRRRSPLPRSPRLRRRSPVRSPRRSPSPYNSRSPPYRSHRSLSRQRDSHANGVESKRYRAPGKRSPLPRNLEKGEAERYGSGSKGTDSMSRQPPISLRSPQRDPRDWNDARNKMPARSLAPENSPSQSESPPRMRRESPNETRVRKLSGSPVRRRREKAARQDSSDASIEEEVGISRGREDLGRKADSLQKRSRDSPTAGSRKKPAAKSSYQEDNSPGKFTVGRSPEARARSEYAESKRKERTLRSDKAPTRTDLPERHTQRTSHISEEVEYGPGRMDNFLDGHDHDEQPSAKQLVRDFSSPDERVSNRKIPSRKTHSKEDFKAQKKKYTASSDDGYSDFDHKKEALPKSLKRVDRNDRMGAADSDSDKREAYRKELERRKHKRSDSWDKDLGNEVGYDSHVDERREAKRRRKEEKKLRREERRRKREERHRRREERRVEKLKAKSIDTVTPPSDLEKSQNDADDSDGGIVERKDFHPSDSEEMESEQKKLEIELRNKALESLRAKKAISH